jgi:hypothetical protein
MGCRSASKSEKKLWLIPPTESDAKKLRFEEWFSLIQLDGNLSFDAGASIQRASTPQASGYFF